MVLFRRQPVADADEERQAPRVRPLAAKVRVQILGRSSIDVLLARDMSVTGLGVFVPHGFAACDLESEVELVITLPGTRTFMAHGRIKHQTATGEPSEYFGVEFTRLDEVHRTRIAEYVEERLRKT